MTGAQEATLATLVALSIDASLRAVDHPDSSVLRVRTSWTAEQVSAHVSAPLLSGRDRIHSTRATLGELRRDGYADDAPPDHWRPTVAGIRAVLS